MTDHRWVQDALQEHAGVVRLDPALVAREWLPAGRRLGLVEAEYDLGERGAVCERWLGSTTRAGNRIGPDDEGLSYLRKDDGSRITLRAAVEAAPAELMGEEYAAGHSGLGRLAKIFDYGARIPFHIHPPAAAAAKVGRSSKDEAYYFPEGVDMGAHPESYLGLHAHFGPDNSDELVADIERWEDDAILRHSVAYLQRPGEGFYVDSGILHAPGTALTIELQEDSDSMAIIQALNAGTIVSDDLIYTDIPDHERAELGARAVLSWIDWDANTDPFFYRNRRLVPRSHRAEEGLTEDWIFYGSPKFVGRRLVVEPGHEIVSEDDGCFNLLVWAGTGRIGDIEVRGGEPGRDELFVSAAAARALPVVNTGETPLEVLKFFGPDIYDHIPVVPTESD
jgi:hypothetical protein